MDPQHNRSGYVPVLATHDSDNRDDVGSLPPSQSPSGHSSSQQSDKKTHSEKASTPHQRRRTMSAWWSTWWQAVTAAVLIVAAATASFATLYPYQGRPLPEWPYHITIGALLSAYSVTLRTAAGFLLADGLAQLKWLWYKKSDRPLYDLTLHDDATRGPLGALLLLWRLHFVPRTWQWLGCILVLVGLLTDPFTQQVLQYTYCRVADNSVAPASIPRVSVFMGTAPATYLNAGAFKDQGLTIAEQAPLNQGLYDPGQVTDSCQSGNCTVPDYTSIGYCARCEDVSSEIQVMVTTCHQSDGGGGRAAGANITTFIPNGLSVSFCDNNAFIHRQPELARLGYTQANVSLTGSFQVVFGLPGKGVDAVAIDPMTGEAPQHCDDMATNQTWRCQGYGAARCNLVPCARSYSANLTNGLFQETVLDEWDDFGHGVWPTNENNRQVFSAIKLPCLTALERDVLRQANYSFSHDTKWLKYDMRTNIYSLQIAAREGKYELKRQMKAELLSLQNRTANRGCIYAVDEVFDTSLRSYIQATFAGSLLGTRTATSNYAITRYSGSQLLQDLYNHGDFSLQHTQSIFNNITLSLTNYMRQNPGDTVFNSSTPATGVVLTMKTCVDVRWVWLSLPITLAVLTLVFFVGVVLVATSLPRDVRTWKSSPLPLLFHAPRFWDHYGHIDDMDRAAKESAVKLEVSDTGFTNLVEK